MGTAQRLEGIAELAAGIAHDFGNLLTAILCSTRVAIQNKDVDFTTKEILMEIERAAENGVDLTQSLLSFGEQQPSKPRLVDLNQIVERNRRWLRRLLGSHIELQIQRKEEDSFVEADPAQLGQVLLKSQRTLGTRCPVAER